MPEFYEARLTRLEKEVNDGDVRLNEPRRLTQQIRDAGRRMSGMFIRRAVQQRRPPADLKISDDPRLQAAWQQRYQARDLEVTYLKNATVEVEGQCQSAHAEIERVKHRLQESRTVTIVRQAPPKKREFSFFERIGRAWKSGRLSVFFQRHELIEQPAHRSVEHLDRLLAEPLPGTQALEHLLAEVKRSQEECRKQS